MKKYALFTSLFFALILAFGCGGPNSEYTAQDALRNEVFAIHDEVMPMMTEIVRLKGSLLEMTADSTKEIEAKAAISQLEKAEDGMMTWMNKFTVPEKLRETKRHEEIMAYLEGEKTEMSKVRDAMLNSIQYASKLLKE